MPVRRWDKSKPPTGPFTLNRDAPQAQGLVLWLPYGGESGPSYAPNYADRSAAGDAATDAGTPKLTLGSSGNPTLLLDGSSHVAVPSSAGLNASDFSVMARINSSALTNGYNAIVHKGDNSVFYQAFVKSNGKLAIFVLQLGGSGSAYDGTGTATLVVNKEYAVGFSYVASSRVLVPYLDGVVDATPGVGNAGTGFSANTFALHIGNDRFTAGRKFTGQLYDIRYYNATLSAGVFADAANAGNKFELWYPLRSRKWMVSAGGGGTATGRTLTAAASLIAGSASGQINATATGQTLTCGASLIAGAASGSASAAGQTLTATASLIPGAATGQVNATASGVTLTATSSLVPGAATSGGTAAGQTLTATASLVAGSATGQSNATASGQTLTAATSLVAGSASGGSAGTAPPATLTANASLIAGSATGQINATAAGVTLTAGVSLIAGSASAANDATALGRVIQAAALFIAGSATGNAGATATGATVYATVALIAGGAYGPTLASTPGFRAARKAPEFTARIGADGRTLPRRRAS